MQCYCYYFRYFARVILIPFIYEAPSIKVGALDAMLGEAYMAISEAISIGKWLTLLPQSDILYENLMVDKVQEVMGGHVEGRLAIQYAMTILCAQEVQSHNTSIFNAYNKMVFDYSSSKSENRYLIKHYNRQLYRSIPSPYITLIHRKCLSFI